jgi:hypothetical protein
MSSLRLFTLCVAAICLLGSPMAHAQAKRDEKAKATEAVVGTWTLLSEVAHQGEKTSLPLGPNPLGSIMLDPGGRFILMVARPDLPKFAGKQAGCRNTGRKQSGARRITRVFRDLLDQ